MLQAQCSHPMMSERRMAILTVTCTRGSSVQQTSTAVDRQTVDGQTAGGQTAGARSLSTDMPRPRSTIGERRMAILTNTHGSSVQQTSTTDDRQTDDGQTACARAHSTEVLQARRARSTDTPQARLARSTDTPQARHACSMDTPQARLARNGASECDEHARW
jgi:hypothetical protein